MIPTESILMAIYILCGLTIAAFGILLTGFYYFGELTMPSVFAWVAPLMIPLGIVTIIVGEREAR
jgi:predicted Co/Zn/Cd cation transporter (cation efflux family)